MLGARKPQRLNKIIKFGWGHPWLKQENLSFNFNYIIPQMSIPVQNLPLLTVCLVHP
jgi:hypothetical protein